MPLREEMIAAARSESNESSRYHARHEPHSSTSFPFAIRRDRCTRTSDRRTRLGLVRLGSGVGVFVLENFRQTRRNRRWYAPPPCRRNEQVRVGTVSAVNCHYDRVNRLHKLSWQLARLACPGKEFGSYLSGNGPILFHQIQRELALPTTKYQP